MKKKTLDHVLETARKLFAIKGVSVTGFNDVIYESGCSESTLRREFAQKIDIYKSVVRMSAERILNFFQTSVLPAMGYDSCLSDPGAVVLRYVHMILYACDFPQSEIHEDVAMLFGKEGRSTRVIFSDQYLSENGMIPDLDLLHEVVLRGCQDTTKARNIMCLVQGMLSEYVQSGSKRKYTVEGIDSIARAVLSASFVDERVSLESMERAGLSVPELSRLSNELRNMADNTYNLLNMLKDAKAV